MLFLSPRIAVSYYMICLYRKQLLKFLVFSIKLSVCEAFLISPLNYRVLLVIGTCVSVY